MIDLSRRIEGLFAGNKVKPILDKLKITQATYYRSIKTGIWKLEHVANIALYFSVSLDWLVLGKSGNGEVEKLQKELAQWKQTATAFQSTIKELIKLKEYETVRPENT